MSDTGCTCAAAVGQLQTDVGNLKDKITGIEQEMENIADAIQQMSSQLSSDLERVHDAVSDSNERLTGILGASGGILVATGLTARRVRVLNRDTQKNLTTIQELSERNTSAMVQLDSIRTYTEAISLSKKSTAFTQEIDQRFGKAVEGVVLNRILYDKHFSAIEENYQSKIRTIGAHIFQIWEEDLHPVEEAARIPASIHQEMAVEVDLQRLAARSSLLDVDLDMIRREHLEPLVALEASFEQKLDAIFAIDGAPDEGTRILVPAAISVDGDGIKVAVGTKIHRSRGGVDLVQLGHLPDHEKYCASSKGREEIRRRCKVRPMQPSELASLSSALESLAARGLVDEALLPGYQEYLRKVPLGIVDGTVELEEVAHA